MGECGQDKKRNVSGKTFWAFHFCHSPTKPNFTNIKLTILLVWNYVAPGPAAPTHQHINNLLSTKLEDLCNKRMFQWTLFTANPKILPHQCTQKTHSNSHFIVSCPKYEDINNKNIHPQIIELGFVVIMVFWNFWACLWFWNFGCSFPFKKKSRSSFIYVFFYYVGLI